MAKKTKDQEREEELKEMRKAERMGIILEIITIFAIAGAAFAVARIIPEIETAFQEITIEEREKNAD